MWCPVATGGWTVGEDGELLFAIYSNYVVTTSMGVIITDGKVMEDDALYGAVWLGERVVVHLNRYNEMESG